MRTEDGKTYQEKPKGAWVHKKSGVEVVRVTPSQFLVRIPNRESKNIVGVDAETRAFLVAGMFVDQLSR